MNSILSKFQKISSWKRKGERAPHKPLLILFAIGEFLNGKTDILFSDAQPKLTSLLQEFGPPRKSFRPEYPFVRLSNDSIWELSNQPLLTTKDYSKSFLKKEKVAGKFKPSVLEEFKKNPKTISEIVEYLLDKNFPSSLHQDILNAVGIEFLSVSQVRKRDQNFREKILKAYEYQCAVCGYNIRLGNSLIGLEAAHIKWHSAGGPDIENNGVALCSLHHKLFDRGAFTLDKQYTILISDSVHGTHGYQDWLGKYHGNMLRTPQRKEYYASPSHISWHVSEVFMGDYRSKY